ncbi:MAG: hypothetical protein PUD12_03785 [Firmicutes bacterium]|nr:hypothetical protein [Bacillota bacterium]
MTQMEMKKMIDERLSLLELSLKHEFEQIEINGEKCYKTSSNEIFTLTPLYSYNAIVIEYADDIEKAKANLYEDGDMFSMELYKEKDMLKAMLQEIMQ